MEKTKQKNGRSTSQEIVSDVAGDREKSSVTPPPTAVNPFGNFWVDVLLMLFYLFILF